MAKKSTKRALIMSILSLVVCISMLIGTTFAWFTDSVTSGKNTIVSGNLDVELDYTFTPDVADSWKTVEGADDLFSKDALWEPGHAEVVYLRIKNVGSLDLKYNFSMNIVSETTAKNVAGEDFKLSSYLKYGFVDYTSKFANREEAIAAVSDTAVTLADYSVSGQMLNGAEKTMSMVVYMPTTVGNEANYRGDVVPQIELGLNLFATQLVSEYDSFNNEYDKGAPWTGEANTDWYFADPDATEFTIDSAEELAGLSALVNGTATAPSTTFSLRNVGTVKDNFKGKTILIGANINLNNIPWTPIGDNANVFLGNFDGQGYVISNLNVSNTGWAGLIGHAGKGKAVDIKNVNIVGATINSNRMAGAVVGQLYGNIDNCSAKNVEITVIPNAVGDSYDNGDKVGGIVGWLGDNNNNHALTNCSVEKATINGYRDIGGIAGYVAYSTTISGNSVKEITISVDQTKFNYGYKDYNAGAIWGRNSVSSSGVGVNASNNTEEDFIGVAKFIKNDFQYIVELPDGALSLYKIPETINDSTIVIPEGVEAIGGYAFAYNDNIEKIILPTSVSTLNDRAFRDTSASEVVLNEGLTNISYQAFRNASNVKSVSIPSTVTTIAKEAFQNSGITSLVVPATVTTIEYGAMRDMKKLETVILNGNATIPVYAFRACTNLRTVVLTGEDVTFDGKGMIFTNKENGDGSAITVYVANETVKERLLAADTASKDYGGYKIIVGSPAVTENVKDVNNTLANGGDVILTDNIYAKYSESKIHHQNYGAGIYMPQGGVLNGNGKTLSVDSALNDGTYDTAIYSNGGVIKNITITSGFRGVFSWGLKEDLYIDNVVFDGALYTINDDSTNGSSIIVTNSVVNGWTSYTYGHNEVSFTKCSFGKARGYAFLRAYNSTKFTECDFKEGYKVDTANGAILTFKNCTYNGVKLTADNITTLLSDSSEIGYCVFE